MENFLIEYKDKIIGSYNDKDIALNFINSCLQNNLMNNVNLITCKTNSCFFINKETFSSEKKVTWEKEIKVINNESTQQIQTVNIPQNTNTEVKDDKQNNIVIVESDEYIKIAKEKIKVQHKINLLKKEKEKMREQEVVYNSDIKLYNIFKETKDKDQSFKIPELFEKKYNIFDKLTKENNLNIDNFYKLYNSDLQKTNYNDYFNMNDYENKFINDSDSEEEFDLDIMKNINEENTNEINDMIEDDSDYCSSEDNNI